MASGAKLDLRRFQKELADRLAAKTTAQVEQSRLGLDCAGQHWLVRLGDAGEVMPVPDVAPVPLTKPWYRGIANIRGNLYSVIDFAAFLGRPIPVTAATVGYSRLVLLGARIAELRAGLIVQRVMGLRNLSDLSRETSPEGQPAWCGTSWRDAQGGRWQELDLVKLAEDPAFLRVGM